ncbi:hypothetical protein D910_08361 [Dendroctonus ponderosae]|uniref:Uncharacterized protein n=1 Tax=Dendroctonus ponderosae TaxID=77166 RepID=U4UAT0_DENPD|nr:hypothetical protein D910_08361 [Dendroctonus ponderosae]
MDNYYFSLLIITKLLVTNYQKKATKLFHRHQTVTAQILIERLYD